MHRIDKSKYVLYIEPPASEKLENPVVDNLVSVMEYALSRAISGASPYSNREDNREDNGEGFSKGNGYRGCHRTECGMMSDNHDYLLENGMITNSLSPFYLKYYRNSIPASEMDKIEELVRFYV